jgi:hypothetical protein
MSGYRIPPGGQVGWNVVDVNAAADRLIDELGARPGYS